MRVALVSVMCFGLVVGCSSPDAVDVASDEQGGVPLREVVLHHEELIGSCMENAGFDYVAVIPGDVLLEEARAEAEANGEDIEAAIDAVVLPEDPNEAIVDGLSEPDQEAYELAFWGPNDVEGCYYTTYEEAWGVDILDLADDLYANLDEAEQRIAVDPEIIEAKSEFVRCINAEGYEVDRFNNLMDYPAKRESEVVQEILDSGATDVLVDDPLWVAYKQEMSVFDEVFSVCEDAYLAVVAPIENSYLGNGG